MNFLKINLSKNILVREEDQSIFLYNCKNDAVLKLSSEIYQKLLAEKIEETEESRAFFEILNQNGMTEDKNKLTDQGEYILTRPGALSTLFELKSFQNPFTALWAITSACNLRCIYCFPNVKSVPPAFDALPIEHLNKIADQIIYAKIFQLTITGGEAFLSKDIWKIIEKIRKNNIKVAVISNGTTINESIIRKAKQFDVIVAVSLDAPNEKVNSITRGKDVFNKTMAGIRQLKTANIPVVILVTLTRFNFPYLGQLIQLIHEEYDVMYVTLQDLRPFGEKADYENFRLTGSQEKELYSTVGQLREKYPKLFFNTTELFMFPKKENQKIKNGKIMQCPAGNNMVYIDFYGDMYPCTNLPTMKLGNVIANGGITKLWRNSEMMRRLRLLKEKNICEIEGCSVCDLNKFCDGGCRGDAIFSGNGIYGRASRCPKAGVRR